jgi:hypothetical protein
MRKTKNADPKARVIEIQNQLSGSARSARTGTGAATAAAASTTTLGSGTRAEHRLGLHRQEAFALQLLACELAGAANRFGLFAGLLLGGLFVVTAELHLAENALTLHLLLQRLESLVDIVIANENLHAASSFSEPEWDRVKARGRQKGLAPVLERADVSDKSWNVHRLEHDLADVKAGRGRFF